jgi:D-alanyl-D-alanine carboxypeptidase (penicillin-binding protein 5/6)
MVRKVLFFLFFLSCLAVFLLYRQDKLPFASPLPKVYGASDTLKQINNWFPKTASDTKDVNFDISAKAAIVVNYDTGEVIFSKNTQERLPAASTIKIMTALLALDNSKLTDKFSVSQKAATVGEDSMGLSEGEQLTLDDLLYGLLLPSGNDAAVTLAEGVWGSEDAFTRAMNDKARQLGLKDTKFINSSGLDEDSEHQYTTAYDLVTLARYMWDRHKDFRRIASTYHIYLEATSSHKAFDLYNGTNLLTTYPGVQGIKPGYTPEAGLCLVTIAENKNVKLIAVILGSNNRRTEMMELLDYGFSKLGIKVDHPALL